jgi:hypothetical protein
MTVIQVPTGRRIAPIVYAPSQAVGPVSKIINEQIENARKPSPTFSASAQTRPAGESIEERLFDALAQFKIRTSLVAMHLDRDWRSKLFGQLDSLLDVQDWEPLDRPPTVESFTTFLRMLIFLRPTRRPGLGATTKGELIATWTVGNDRLTIECLPLDLVRWSLSVSINDDRERAAGISPVARLRDVLSPYGPDRWFADADRLPRP